MQELLSFTEGWALNPPLKDEYDEDYEHRLQVVGKSKTDFIVGPPYYLLKISFPEPLQSVFEADSIAIGLAERGNLYLCNARKNIFYTLRNHKGCESKVKLIVAGEEWTKITAVFVTEDDLIYAISINSDQDLNLILTRPTRENELFFQTAEGDISEFSCLLVQSSPLIGVVLSIYCTWCCLYVVNERDQLFINGTPYIIAEHKQQRVPSTLVLEGRAVDSIADDRIYMVNGEVVETAQSDLLSLEQIELIKRMKFTLETVPPYKRLQPSAFSMSSKLWYYEGG